MAERGRRKLVVATTFPVHPPLGGGQVRAFELYRRVAREWDVTVVSLGPEDAEATTLDLGPGFSELRVPMSAAHATADAELAARAGVPVTDIAFGQLHELTPAYRDALARATADAALVVSCHPFPLPAIEQVWDGPLVYESHDVEAELKEAVLAADAAGAELLDQTRTLEARCCAAAELVVACSREDAEAFARLYGVPAERRAVVPNGVDLERVSYVAPAERRKLRQMLGMDEPLAAFVGSSHPPNVEAVRALLGWAPRLPEVTFVVAGTAADAVAQAEAPANVDLAGVVSEPFKESLMSVADVALNPVLSGSGTNLKMLEYMATGVTAVSTPHGARGLGLSGEEAVLAEPDEMPARIREVLAEPEARQEARAAAARRLVEQHFGWDQLAGELVERLSRLDAR